MRLRPPGAPVADPLLAEVRRRHPDLDVVVLPPAARPAVLVDPAWDAELEQGSAAVAAAAATVLSALGLAVVPPALRFGRDEGTVRPAVRWSGYRPDTDGPLVGPSVGPPDGAPEEPLDVVAAELDRHGWATHRLDGPVQRLGAVLDDLDLTLLHATSTDLLTLTVLGAEVAVGLAEARQLVGRAA